MFRHNLKKMLMLIAALMVITSLTSCGSDSSENGEVEAMDKTYDHVAIVVGNHRNSPKANLESTKDIIAGTCYVGGDVSVIEADGRPHVVDSINIPEAKEGISESTRERNSTSQANEICEYVKMVEPRTSESDVLNGIVLAGKMLNNYDNGNKLLLVYDTGIVTTGPLDMSISSYQMMDTDSIVRNLREQSSIPDLNGVDIVWINLGEPTGDQEKPSEKAYKKLKADYKAILEEAGAAYVRFIATGALTDEQTSKYPPVKTVEFANSTVLSEDSLSFKKGSTEFVNSDKAQEQIELVAESYNANEEVLVVGCASSEGNKEANETLSYKRAKKVAAILEDYGIKTDVVGLGYDTRYCQNDCDANGNLEESKAKNNRKIVILSASSTAAKEIKG